MNDLDFGRMSGTHLKIRPLSPLALQHWGPNGWQFSTRLLLSPARWWRAILQRSNWAFHFRHHREASGRCYCPTGSHTILCIRVAGFGCWAWLSRFTGSIPCPCDRALWAAFPEDYADELAADAAK